MELSYGPYLPLHALEEIRSWKDTEMGCTNMITSIAPELEEAYVELLNEWGSVFQRSADAADDLLQRVSTGVQPPDDYALGQLDVLLAAAFTQSKEFHRHLGHILEHSAALSSNPAAEVVFRYIQDQSEQTVNRLRGLDQPAAISQRVKPRSIWNEEPFPYPEVSSPRTGPSEELVQELSAALTVSDTAAADSSPPASPVPIGGHKLPPLPYPYNALEPYIDEKTMRIHHDKHHKTYVDDLNTAEKKLQEARQTGNFELVKHWERELAFNGAGHYLHTIFWDTMSPNGGGKPVGSLGEQIRKDFGSYEAFKKHFTEAANKVEGGGWAVLVWSPRAHRLEILQAEKHQNLSQYDIVPLLPLDVWEHAYYLKHQNERKKYITDWWNVVNWPAVAERFQEARKLKWTPY
ncbi:Fe-Mn family superoxide dismutase [Paenibacillus urinalis]|uniref:Fe-Mn family superoxide dismutase n=1 Tax=Paenibacillus urinalis TaxID=521520 RepID=UPI002367D39B|nr:Fe-Mn family superoxide dismutase [Paenibacillus urinalis]WDH99278.1 Fe-Mn family superoxide dismutase [Paenibacillus urinalis]